MLIRNYFRGGCRSERGGRGGLERLSERVTSLAEFLLKGARGSASGSIVQYFLVSQASVKKEVSKKLGLSILCSLC